MQPHRSPFRLRASTLVLCSFAAAVAAAWIACMFFSLTWRTYPYLNASYNITIRIGYGSLSLEKIHRQSDLASFGVRPTSYRYASIVWWAHLEDYGALGWSAIVPLWVLEIPFAIASIRAYRNDLRLRKRWLKNHCCVCGYDLKASPKGTSCPECGSMPNQSH